MNGYYETDEHVKWRWEARKRRAEQIAKEKAEQSATQNNNA